ncbi:SIMPL domain-containing protein [Methylocapsa sp. S129]|uniref:SIMPL domain-containing protein n=1 Tax=Methylocapsa sp. S129 TaxID=1641869 RepID=UPI00131E7B49|nr:SIMPL domain-containing protein [Methylocapsa sp. S129]
MLAHPVPRSFLIALMLACSLGVAQADEAARPTIETTGESTVGARPDFATITIGEQSAAKTAQAALADNSKATAALIEALKGAGVEAKDIQTSDFSIRPQMSNVGRSGGEPTTIVGYSVSNRVRATLHDLTRLGDVLDKAVAAGANSVNGIQFGVANASILLDEARKAAFADARRKAELYAGEAGVKLGALASLEETGAAMPVYANAAGMPAAMAAPIESGQSTLSVGVRARFEIAR